MTLLAPSFVRPLEVPTDGVDVYDLARAPRWSPGRTAALHGRCSGVLLADWAENFGSRWGDRAVDTIRDGLGSLGEGLSDAPGAEQWFPAGLQLRITEILLDEVVDGDVEALRDALRDLVGRRGAVRFLARRLGIERILRRASGVHERCYDVGRADIRVRRREVTIHTTGTPLAAHPTWQLLQLIGLEVLTELTGRQGAVVFGRGGLSQSFEAHVRW